MPTLKMRGAVAQMAGKGKFLMAVRHDVENLTRRDNIFCWRTRPQRVPAMPTGQPPFTGPSLFGS